MSQKYSPKIKYFFASFSNDRVLSLDDKTKDYATEIPEVKSIHYRRSHNLGNIRGENLRIWAVEQKNSFLEKNIFIKKTTPQLLGRTGLQTMKVGVKANFGWLAAVCLMHVDIRFPSMQHARHTWILLLPNKQLSYMRHSGRAS